MNKRIYRIEFIAGNPELYQKKRQTEMLTRSEAFDRWNSMTEMTRDTWRMWLKKNGEIVERSARQIRWEKESNEK